MSGWTGWIRVSKSGVGGACRRSLGGWWAATLLPVEDLLLILLLVAWVSFPLALGSRDWDRL